MVPSKRFDRLSFSSTKNGPSSRAGLAMRFTFGFDSCAEATVNSPLAANPTPAFAAKVRASRRE